MKNEPITDYSDILEQIYSYFPDCKIIKDSTNFETEDGSTLLVGHEKILPYLQTILFEEHLLEVQIDFTTRFFYANLLDDLPQLVETEVDGEILLEEPDYEVGSYLRSIKDIVLTPLTPGMGNVKVQNSNQVIIRFFTGTSAIELGTKFLNRDNVQGLPALRLAYPEIGRVNKNYRSFRVKTISTVAALVCINGNGLEESDKKYFHVFDISAMGLAFSYKDDDPPYSIDERVSLEVKVPDINNLKIRASVRHISKVRTKGGYEHICGVQFDLETRAIAEDIEKLVAAIQRLQLREIVEKTSDLKGVTLIK